MPPGSVARIVAELIFLLLAEYGKRCDRRGKLVIAERLKSRDGVKSCAERKCQREAIVRIPRFGVVQPACVEGERTQPRRAERKLVANHQVQVIRSRSRAGRWQRGLLNQVVSRGVVIVRSAQEPLRP